MITTDRDNIDDPSIILQRCYENRQCRFLTQDEQASHFFEVESSIFMPKWQSGKNIGINDP